MVADNDLYELLVRLDALGDCTCPRDAYAATQASAESAERALFGAVGDGRPALWMFKRPGVSTGGVRGSP